MSNYFWWDTKRFPVERRRLVSYFSKSNYDSLLIPSLFLISFLSASSALDKIVWFSSSYEVSSSPGVTIAIIGDNFPTRESDLRQSYWKNYIPFNKSMIIWFNIHKIWVSITYETNTRYIVCVPIQSVSLYLEIDEGREPKYSKMTYFRLLLEYCLLRGTIHAALFRIQSVSIVVSGVNNFCPEYEGVRHIKTLYEASSSD